MKYVTLKLTRNQAHMVIECLNDSDVLSFQMGAKNADGDHKLRLINKIKHELNESFERIT